MKILIVGAGGREHSIAWKAAQSPQLESLAITPGNGGMESLGDCWGLTEIGEIVSKAQAESIDLVIVGQEDYLVDGIYEALDQVGIACCGPGKEASQLEGSKVYSKDFMARHQIPTAAYGNFSDFEQAKQFLTTLQPPYVIKASGLAAGKGVLILDSLEEATAGLKSILLDRAFGEAGSQVVIEEFMPGEEASYFVFTDGENFVSMPSLQDHKRQGELDRGPNTGGMGCYVPAPVVTEEVEAQVLEQVVIPTLEGMKKDGHPYRGILYIGLMIEAGHARVVEYNIRFGDPECQPLMMMLESDLLPIAMACARGGLSRDLVSWKSGACANVVLASGGYPASYQKGYAIQGLDQSKTNLDRMVFHAGTKRDGSQILTNGGRVLGCTARGESLSSAINNAYGLAEQISWPGMQFRRDIGVKGLKRIMEQKQNGPMVGILMGSASDKKIALKAAGIFKEFGIPFEAMVASAHRTPERAHGFIHDCEAQGVEVFIAIAGLAAHLPGVVASATVLPVIGVPVDSNLDGADALYSIVQMPPGIPVASVGIGRGENAALLAIQILGAKYPELKQIHQEYRIKMAEKVVASQAEIDEALGNL